MKLKTRAKELRKEQTDAENFLWRRLRDRRLVGYKFRRQLTLPPYIVDFVCLDAKLIVEVDGAHHLLQQEYDKERTKYLQAQGFTVLRFWNDEVMKDTDVVLEVILSRLQELRPASSASSPHPRSLSHKGRGMTPPKAH